MLYGEKLLFMDVDLALKPGNKYGLVGPNGAGKSTFIRILLEKEHASLGEITKPKRSRITSLEQDHFKYENNRIIDVVIMGRVDLWKAIESKHKILEKGNNISEEDCFALGDLENIIADNDGYSAESEAEILLTGLGIDPDYHYKPLNTLSGGLKLRVLMAKCLFANPDYMLLDEPSNHLDIVSIRWLENYLINTYAGTLILVSHDHDLINNICNKILDIDYGEIREYTGNYDKFLSQKQQIEEIKLAEYQNKSKQLEKARRFIERFRASATRSRQALSREKQIDKIEMPEIKPSSRRAPNMKFIQDKKTGKIALDVKKICKSYPNKEIFKDISFRINRSDKLAILGKNGAGKTTMLKSILGEEMIDSGIIEFGAGAKVGYFSQDHHEQLKENMTALEWLISKCSNVTENEVRGVLGQMLFAKDEALKKLSVLSGGEAARLLMAKLMLEKPNIIILDEPTNHLDIETIHALQKALRNYEGTVIFVSHDRNFIKSVSNRIIYLDNKKIDDVHINVDQYLEEKFS